MLLGNALADVVFGGVNPSGRLPYTIAKDINDYSAKVITSGSGTVQIPYNEGLFIDYRHFDAVSKTSKSFAQTRLSSWTGKRCSSL